MTVDLFEDPLEKARIEAAWRVHEAYDIELPHLALWNYSPCEFHAEEGAERPVPGCEVCGIEFRRHQRVGISWLYLVVNGLLADSVGTGKTVHAAALTALLTEKGDLGPDHKTVVVCRPVAVPQWHEQLNRTVPSLNVISATGTAKKRLEKYVSPWNVCVIGYQMMQNDVDRLMHFDTGLMVVDDVDPLRRRSNKTARVIKKFGAEVDRTVVMSGTPLQKRLDEMHSVLEPIGGLRILGSWKSFDRRYVRSVYQQFWRGRRKVHVKKVVGYKNVGEFKELIAPIALRRTAADIDDVELPAIVPNSVWLDLYPSQRRLYEELRQGVLRIQREQGEEVSRVEVLAQVLYGAKVCSGLGALDMSMDGPSTSSKMDWTIEQLTNDLGDEKVLIFCNFKDSIRCMQNRMDEAEIRHVTIWGDESNTAVRQRRIADFKSPNGAQVLIGTTSIEQSLNLQVSRHLVAMDTIMNPARMEQLAGRLRRDGSQFSTVYVHNLWCVDTQEEKYKPALEREQALIDNVWDEDSELFDSLSSMQLLQLIGT